MQKSIKTIRNIVYLILGTIVLGACTGSEPSPHQEVNTLEGVEIELDEQVYNQEENTFLLRIKNNSDNEVTYGVAFALEMIEDDEWVIVEPEEELSFIAIAHILSPGEEADEEINLEFYEPLESGHYRIVREIQGEVLAAEFQVR